MKQMKFPTRQTPAPVKPAQGRAIVRTAESIRIHCHAWYTDHAPASASLLTLSLVTHTHIPPPSPPSQSRETLTEGTVSGVCMWALTLFQGTKWNKKGSVQASCGSQQLRLCPPNVWGLGSIPGQELDPTCCNSHLKREMWDD